MTATPDIFLCYNREDEARAKKYVGHISIVLKMFCLDFVDEAFTLLDRPYLLFPAAYTKLRADPRFVKRCARLGLVEYWLATGNWAERAATVPYDFQAEC